MVEATLLKSNKSGFYGGIDEPTTFKLDQIKAKDVVLIVDPFQEQLVMQQINKISAASKCNKLGLLLSPVSALYGVNETTGLVIDINDTGLYLSTVFEGKFLPYCSLKYPYSTDDLFIHFKREILPKIQHNVPENKYSALFQALLKESVPNDERDCAFIAIEEEEAFEGEIKLDNDIYHVKIPIKSRIALFDDLLKNHNFFDILYFTLSRIPNRIRNTLASHILLTGAFVISDFESIIRTGLFKYLCNSDQVNENQLNSIAFINRLAIDYLEIAREQALLWFAGGQMSRKYLMQDEKYHLSQGEFGNINLILNKLCN